MEWSKLSLQNVSAEIVIVLFFEVDFLTLCTSFKEIVVKSILDLLWKSWRSCIKNPRQPCFMMTMM